MSRSDTTTISPRSSWKSGVFDRRSIAVRGYFWLVRLDRQAPAIRPGSFLDRAFGRLPTRAIVDMPWPPDDFDEQQGIDGRS